MRVLKSLKEMRYTRLIIISFILTIISLIIFGWAKEEEYKSEIFQTVLQDFYEATYISADLEMMKEPLVDEYKFYFEQAMTMGEMDKEFYKSYKIAADTVYGDEYTLNVKVNAFEKVEKKSIKKIEDRFRNVEDAVMVYYEIIFEGNMKSKYKNNLVMVKVYEHWYMTTHLDLPIGRNVYAY